MSRRQVLPRHCLWITGLSIFASALAPNAVTAIAQWGAMMAFVSIIESRLSTAWTSVALSLPFAPLLLLIHGGINPTFALDANFCGLFPYRSDGVMYALLITSRIGLLMLGFVSWRNIRRSEFVQFTLTRRWLPQSAALALLQVTTLFRVFTEKIGAILVAQRSRGVPVDANIWNRIVYFPAAVIPLVASVLVETDHRHRSLSNRGLGTGPIRLSYRAPEMEHVEIAIAVLSVATTVGVLLATT